MLSERVEAAQRGETAAMQEVLASLAPSLYRFGLRMCHHREDAEDVVQDALLIIAKELPGFQGRSSLSSWAFAIARSACSRRRRGRKNEPMVELPDIDERMAPDPDPERTVEQRELEQAVSRAITQLPEEQREALLLRDSEGLSAVEAASAIGITVENLKSRLHRARRALHEAVQPLLEPGVHASADCPDIIGAWSAELEGDLRAEDCTRMQKHLDTCPRCAATCGALRREVQTCSSFRTGPVNRDVRARVEAAFRAWQDEFRRVQ